MFGIWISNHIQRAEESLAESLEVLEKLGIAEDTLQQEWGDQLRVQSIPLQGKAIGDIFLGTNTNNNFKLLQLPGKTWQLLL